MVPRLLLAGHRGPGRRGVGPNPPGQRFCGECGNPLGIGTAAPEIAGVSAENYESMPSISIDYALGVGGFPRGRICEIFGPESSGKTTLALQVIAQAQKLGGMAAFVEKRYEQNAPDELIAAFRELQEEVGARL